MDANKPIVKVKADYESFPLWQHDSAELANIDPATLPISPELVQELLDWADTYGRTVNSSHPWPLAFRTQRPKTPSVPMGRAWPAGLRSSWIRGTRSSTSTPGLARGGQSRESRRADGQR